MVSMPAMAEETTGPPALTVQSDRATWDLKGRSVVFDGHVHAVRADVTLKADRMEVRYTRPERMESATATGHVVLARGDRVVEAAQATLDVASGRLVLEGDPRMIEAGHRLQGQKVVLWLDQDRVECISCTLIIGGEAVAPAHGGTERATP